MKQINLASKIATAWVFYFIIYNIYFGWNIEPINDYEEICDLISKVWILIVFFIYTMPLFGLYRYHVTKMENDKNRNDGK